MKKKKIENDENINKKFTTSSGESFQILNRHKDVYEIVNIQSGLIHFMQVNNVLRFIKLK